MKIARLALAAFGPFTDTTLDFTGAPGALQVVYGPNEAGKSTTLRALTALLYGVPVRTGDAHVHDMTRLRVGATLLDADGNEVTVTRRKGAKSTLLDASNEPVDEAGLTRLLGGLDETLFRQMFGLDHVTLRAGGEALLAGEGQLGETLFSAASGARGVSQLIASLRAQLDGLYKARGKQPRLNQALERLHACERRTKDAMLSPQSYIDQKRALEEARIGRDRALVQRRALLSEQSQLGRRIAILPVLRRREELLRAPVTVAPTSGDEAALATLLVELTRRHAGVLAALEARPAQLAERALLERDVAELRARLGAAAAASALETPVRARLRKLADEARALAEEQRELTRALAEHEDDARPERAGDDDAQLSAQTLALLTERIELAERAGLAGLPRQAAELARREALIARGAAQLGVAVEAAALSRLALPDEAQLAALEALTVRTQRAAERLDDERARHASESAELSRQRAALLASGALPSASDLADARKHRDALLARIADAARAGAVEVEPLARLESAIGRADAIADQLRREARRAAEFHQLEGRAAALSLRAEQLGGEGEALEAERVRVGEAARALLAPVGLDASRPERARAALTRLEALVAQATEHEALRAQYQSDRARAATLARDLREACGEPAGDMSAGSEPDDALERAQVRARRRLTEATEARREQVARRAQREERALRRTRAQAALEALATRTEAFRTGYAHTLRGLGFDDALAPDEVLACLDDLAALGQKSRELSSLTQRLAAQDEERAALADEVQQALVRFAPDWVREEGAPPTVEATLAELSRRQRARVAAREEAERRASELQRLDAQLADLGDGASLDALAETLQGFEPHAARARLSELEDELEQASVQLGELEQSVGRLEGGLENLHETPGASASAEELSSELARARALAREYYETRLALSVLQREVERYRREHQGPVLARARALFPRLTLGRYAGLAVEYDEQDRPVLACVRHDEKCVRVSGLSDGTRDQLYFALRVASIERFVERGAALPLVLDDAFIHFDDDRAKAALEVLGELCARTQVVFFTHHARMVELAHRALGRDRVALHQLPRVAGVVAQPDHGPLFA